jgi:hypothetical protein
MTPTDPSRPAGTAPRALRGLPAVTTEPPYDDENPAAGPTHSAVTRPDELPRAGGQPGRPARTPGARRGPGTGGSSRGRGGSHGAGPVRGPVDIRPPTTPGGGTLPRGHARAADDPPPAAGRATAPATRRAPTRFPQQALDSRLRENPGPAATIVVRAIVEVLGGVRPATHLAGWATPSLQAALERFGGRYPGRTTVRSIRVTEPRPGVAEVVAVISRGDRVAALALRMVTANGRWQATTLQIG